MRFYFKSESVYVQVRVLPGSLAKLISPLTVSYRFIPRESCLEGFCSCRICNMKFEGSVDLGDVDLGFV